MKQTTCNPTGSNFMISLGLARKARFQETSMTMTKEVTDCIDACTSCAEICRECVTECKTKGGMDLCVKLCNDCANICDQHAISLHKGDHSHAASCIAACEACAVECDKFPSMDICRTCADACRNCAKLCNKAEAVKA